MAKKKKKKKLKFALQGCTTFDKAINNLLVKIYGQHTGAYMSKGFFTPIKEDNDNLPRIVQVFFPFLRSKGLEAEILESPSHCNYKFDKETEDDYIVVMFDYRKTDRSLFVKSNKATDSLHITLSTVTENPLLVKESADKIFEFFKTIDFDGKETII